MARLGDRVLGQWEPEWFYPGVVVAEAGAMVQVQFDDGDRAMLKADQVRMFSLSAGTRVHCRWQGGEGYYPGVVSSVTGLALGIDYDDGDREVTTASLCRIHVGDLV